MNIKEIHIKNFRLLRDVGLSLNTSATVIVGRNNSGKTSLTELIRRLLIDRGNFHLEDFSLCSHIQFWKAFELYASHEAEEKIRNILPTISVQLIVEYDLDAAILGALSEFVIDLNPDSSVAIIDITYKLIDGGIKSLFEEISFQPSQKRAFFKTISERIKSLYRNHLTAIDPNDEGNRRNLDWSKLQALLKSGFISAQRGLDDETYREKDILGKILEGLFNSADKKEASEIDKELAAQLQSVADGLQTSIDSDFTDNLEKFLPAMSLFGYPGLSDPGLGTETTIDIPTLLKNHTRIKYKNSGEISLPESFNGLGTRNLIYILFRLFEFFKSFLAQQGEPSIHLIFIEEPEAHLHPQMQEVFIRQLNEITKIFAKVYNEGKPWPVQFIVSTHSSHIANAAPFDAMRYFIASNISDTVPFRQTRIKDLSTGLGGTPQEVKEFLHKYMTLTRCDLLFADKAILVEGATERILLPKMISKIDEGREEQSCLSRQYITILEVGGAYAHIFIGLLNFLELKALIITDIDCTEARITGKLTSRTKCIVSKGTHTSNATIMNWFSVQAEKTTNHASQILIAKTAIEKTKGNIYLTYQLPEEGSILCGRSFEAAFILANPNIISLKAKTDSAKEMEIWDETLNINKTEFALKYSINEDSWNIPRYIKEGLDWLASPISSALESTQILPPTQFATPQKEKKHNLKEQKPSSDVQQ